MNFPAELWNKGRRELHAGEAGETGKGRGPKRGGWNRGGGGGLETDESRRRTVSLVQPFSGRTSYKEISRGRPRRKVLRDILAAITVFLAILVADRTGRMIK